MSSTTYFNRIVSCVLSITLNTSFIYALVQNLAYAAPPASATLGATEARSLMSKGPGFDADSNGNRTFYYTDENNNPASLNFSNQDFYGGETVNDSTAWENQKNAYGDSTALGVQTSNAESNASSGSGGASDAYQTFKKSQQLSRPKLDNDPIFSNSSRILQDVQTGTVNCGSGSPAANNIEMCQRSNIVDQCSVERKVEVHPVTFSRQLIVQRGCFEHNGFELRIKFPGAVEKELQGYFIDRETGTRYDQDANGRFITVPDSKLRSGPALRTYPNLQRTYGGSPQGLYGITRADIANQYPELNLTVTDLNDPGNTDNTAYSYFKIIPIDSDNYDDGTIKGSLVTESVTVSQGVTTAEYEGTVFVLIKQQPEEANGWVLKYEIVDGGTSGTTPTCPVYSAYGSNNSHAGWHGTGFINTELNIDFVGYVISETVTDFPVGCSTSGTPSCPLPFTCTDDADVDYSPIPDDIVRSELTPLYPGDDPSDTSKKICYQASATSTCSASSYGYNQGLSCSNQQSRQECAFLTSECTAFTPSGDCAYFTEKYNCGFDSNYDTSCAVRQEIIDEFSACERVVTPTTSTNNVKLSEIKSCEVIHDLTTCNRTKTLTGPDTATINNYPAESGNNPCVASPDGFVKAANWVCNQTTPITPPVAGPYPELYPGDTDGQCIDATVTYQSDWYYQSMPCYTDVNGNTQCPQGTPSNVNKDTCEVHRNNGCTLVSRKCVEGASTSGGFCYAEEFEYDCGKDVAVEETTYDSEWSCSGNIQCMGNSCIKEEDENNESFAEAVAAMNAVQFAAQDAECDGLGNCTLFSGKPMKCKKALGGYQDCCENPGTASLAEFLLLLYKVGKSTGATAAIGLDGAVVGAWKAISEPVVNALPDVITNYFTSVPENVAGGAASTSFANTAAKFIGDTFGDAAREALFTGVTENGTTTYSAGTFLQTAGAVMGYIMLAYMIYQLVVLAIQIIYKCTEEEFELGGKKDLRVCHKVGSYCKKDTVFGCIEKIESYCCYNSPLGRIINEQAAPQLGNVFGTPKNPTCPGLTITEFGNLDWSRIDLSEWTAMLTESGLAPKSDPSELAKQYSMEAVTGKGHALSSDEYPRDTTLERMWDRQPDDPNKVHNDLEQSIRGQE